MDCHEAWYRRTPRFDDVTVVLRGLRAYVPNPQHTNLLSVLSHPERVSLREMTPYAARGCVAG